MWLEFKWAVLFVIRGLLHPFARPPLIQMMASAVSDADQAADLLKP